MGRLLGIWRSWSARRRAVAAVAAALAVAGAALGAYLVLKRPADVHNADAAFVKPKPKPKPKPKTTDWPIFGLNPERTRYLPGKNLDPPLGKAIWSVPLGRLIEQGPVLVGKVMYIQDVGGSVYAYDTDEGKRIWRKDVGALSAASPAVHDGIVYALDLDPDQIVAMKARNGHILWRKPIDAPGSESTPLFLGNKLIFGCQCGSVYALDRKTGRKLWQTDTGGEVKGAVALHNGTLFGDNYSGIAFAIDAKTGKTKWTQTLIGGGFARGGGAYSTPAVAYGRVYLGGLDGRVYSLEEKTGEIAWSQSTGAEVYPGPVVAEVPGTPPSVYIGSLDGNVYAYAAKDGKPLWSAPVNGGVTGSAALIGHTVYFGVIGSAKEQGTYGFDAKTGKQVFFNELGEYTPMISDGHKLYLIGYSTVRAFDPEKFRRKRHRKILERQAAAKRKAAKAKGHGGKRGKSKSGKSKPKKG